MKTSRLLFCLVCVSVTTAQGPDKNCVQCLRYCARDPSLNACRHCVKMGCQPSDIKSSNGDITRVSVKMSSVLDGIYPGTNCIDNNVDSFCHTKGGEAWPWVAVEIPPSYVYQVWIINRADCCGERTKNLKVWVGDQFPTTASSEYSSGKLLDIFQGPGTDGQVIKIQSQTRLQGRYVVVQMSRKDYLNLAEIYVFGS